MLDPARYHAITFDCFGTLIDWETGIVRALEALFARDDTPIPDPSELLSLYARFEPAAQRGDYRTYRKILAQVTCEIATHYGVDLASGQENLLADSIATWPIYTDTPKTLAALHEHYDLAILSNIDRDLFAPVCARLTNEYAFDFAAVITSQDTQSYKPAIGHFWQAMQTLDLPGARLLHVAQSLYHDIVPAQSLGISTVWINRNGISLGATDESHTANGATPAIDLPENVGPDIELPDLASLAHLLCAI